jgi:hypothetical protein
VLKKFQSDEFFPSRMIGKHGWRARNEVSNEHLSNMVGGHQRRWDLESLAFSHLFDEISPSVF